MRTPVLVFVFATFTASAFAANSPWAGTWKLDPARSKFTGDTFSYTRSPDGMMHYTNGSTTEFAFQPDGKDYPGPFGGTISVTGKGPSAWTEVDKRNGKVLSTSDYTLSPDGKTLAIHSSGNKPDGSSFSDDVTYTRLSGSKGPEGKWRSTKVNISAPNTWIIAMPSPTEIKWEIPEFKGTLEGKLDGSDIAIAAPEIPKGLTMALKPASSHKLTYVEKVAGKPVMTGYLTLAPDGKSITDTGWDPGKPNEKQLSFFARQ